MRKLFVLALLVLALLCSGCTRHSHHAQNTLVGEELTARLLPNPPAGAQPEPQEKTLVEPELAAKAEAAMADLTVQMLQQAMAPEAAENVLLSPVSLVYALGMTANGAGGETLAQLEKALGLSREELNGYLAGFMQDEDEILHLANSIWFRADPKFAIEEQFLQVNKDCYNAQLYAVPFDNGTLQQINDWVKQQTKEMIPQILPEISEDAVMYLINALAFEAEWDLVYEDSQIRPAHFTAASGAERDVQMMYGTEYRYLEDEQTCGFIKYYKGQRYAFAALLPNEDVPLADYVAGLSGEKLLALLENAQAVEVQTAIPQFACDYSLVLNDLLKAMGVQNAFDPDLADFLGIGNYDSWPLYIDQVLQKCHIEVDAKGTKAAAATVVAMNKATSAAPVQRKYVYLDRPFVYLLLDYENDNLPLFVGVVTDINE